jgi:hypothetical protein
VGKVETQRGAGENVSWGSTIPFPTGPLDSRATGGWLDAVVLRHVDYVVAQLDKFLRFACFYNHLLSPVTMFQTVYLRTPSLRG